MPSSLSLKKLRVYLGFDSREVAAFDVARHSILSRTKRDVEVKPLVLSELDMVKRPIEWRGEQMWCPISDAPMSTEFSNSRFVIPFIQKSGWCLFADDDIVCLADIGELFDLADDKYAVMVVKHNHNPIEEFFPDGRIQTRYSRKNWSSVVLWNCDHPANKRFTLEDFNSWPGRDMHAFKWLKDEEIGALPKEWNHLVGVDSFWMEANLLHYTLGGPWLKNWEPAPLDHVWVNEFHAMMIP